MSLTCLILVLFFLGTDAAAHIKVGSYYEIDHSKLPTKTPGQLKLVRVIMVPSPPLNELKIKRKKRTCFQFTFQSWKVVSTVLTICGIVFVVYR